MVWEDPAKSVRKPPGSVIGTLIPSGPTSFASTSEKPPTPHWTDASSHGRELQDPARSLTSHHRDGRLGQIHDAKEIGLKLGTEVQNGRVLDRGKVPIAGVVDQHIEAAEDVNGQLDGRHRRTLIGDIQRDGAPVVAVTLNQIGELLWIAGGGD